VRYEAVTGCDQAGHLQYVRYVAEKHSLPTADVGWETLQPPLYYVLAAGLWNALRAAASPGGALGAVRLLGAAAAALHLLLVWFALGKVFPELPRCRNLGLVAVAFLPVTFLFGPLVSNEGFAALVVGVVILLAVQQDPGLRISWRRAAVLGLLCGLAMLSKYTGVFITASVVLALAMRASARERRSWLPVIAAATTAAGVGGWFYVRNLKLFGTPFPGVWTGVLRWRISQFPGYTTASFFTHLGGSLVRDPENSVFASFWDGLYATLWTGVQSCGFLDRRDPAVLRLEGVILCLALVPTAAVAMGFFAAARSVVRDGWESRYLVPVLTSMFTVAGLIHFTLQVPFFSSVKARYLWSLLIPAALFAALGLDRMARRLGRLRWLLYFHLAVLSGLILRLCWLRLD
jgi:hypothetical protein